MVPDSAGGHRGLLPDERILRAETRKRISLRRSEVGHQVASASHLDIRSRPELDIAGITSMAVEDARDGKDVKMVGVGSVRLCAGYDNQIA